MSAALNHLGSELFGLLGQLSVELAALAVIVLLVGHVLRITSPALRHFLWVTVLLKPIIAVTVRSPWTLFAPLISSLGLDWFALGHSPPVSSVEAARTMAASPPTIAGSISPLTVAGWVALLWILGAALLMGRIVIGFGVIRRLRRGARVHRDGALFDALQEARLALDVNPRIDVATSRSIRSPIVLGILNPLIVVPADLLKRVGSDELKMVLMHELAHVRRYDNLILLMQRLIGMALFFHPAVWLCGRMLRQEAEQACDDLVVWSTGRSEDYARGLTSVAELAHLKSHLKRRIPVMSVFAAAESDLALRIRRTLDGGVRRMGVWSRVLAAVLLFGMAIVILPSCGTNDDRTGVATEAQEALKAAGEEETRDAAASDLDAIARRIRAAVQRGDLTPEEGRKKMAAIRERMAAEEKARDGVDWDAIAARIRAAIERGEMTPEEGREKMAAIRERMAGEEKRDEVDWDAAMATPPEEWSEALKAQIVAAGYDLEEIAEKIRERRAYAAKRDERKRGEVDWDAAMATPPEEWSEALKAQIVAAGYDLDEVIEGIRKRQEYAAKRDEKKESDGVDWDAAMATSPEDWSAELKAQIVAAGYDVEEIAERIRERQQEASTRTR